jgi:DNA-binding transcriptional LysR family regulator
MDLIALQTFVAVAQAGSLNRAAAELHLSQASVSRHVQRLESELATGLFVRRDGRALELTPAGERVLELGGRLLEDSERAWDRLRDAAAQVRPRVVVGVASLISLVPRFQAIFASFGAAHPDVDVELVESSNFSATLRDAVHGAIDVGIGGLEEETRPPSIEPLYVLEVGPRVVLPATHPLAQRDSLTLHDIADETFAFLEDSSMLEQFTAACAAAGLRPRIAHRCSQAITLAGLMASGTLLTAIYSEGGRTFASPLAEVLVQIPLEMPGPDYQLAVYWSRERRLSVAARQFLSHLRKRLDEDRSTAETPTG